MGDPRPSRERRRRSGRTAPDARSSLAATATAPGAKASGRARVASEGGAARSRSTGLSRHTVARDAETARAPRGHRQRRGDPGSCSRTAIAGPRSKRGASEGAAGAGARGAGRAPRVCGLSSAGELERAPSDVRSREGRDRPWLDVRWSPRSGGRRRSAGARGRHAGSLCRVSSRPAAISDRLEWDRRRAGAGRLRRATRASTWSRKRRARIGSTAGVEEARAARTWRARSIRGERWAAAEAHGEGE